jgi:peptide/nickel transport system substrate-binding protein
VVAVNDIREPVGTPRFNSVQSLHLKFGFMEPPIRMIRSAGGGLEVQPWLATAWKLASDQAYVDLTIRKGVKFHGGYGEMTADDWVFSFNDAMPGVTPGATNDMGGDLTALFKRADKIDDSTVRLTYNIFQSNWLERYLSSFWEGHVIYSKRLFDEKGPDGMRPMSIGTGPLRVTKYENAKELVMEAFPDYWGTPSTVKDVKVLQVLEEATRKAMLQTGQAHIVNLPVKDRVDILKSPGFALGKEGTLGENAIAFGGNWWETTHVQTGAAITRVHDLSQPFVSKSESEDPAGWEKARKVREALGMAIDRENLNKGIFLGQGAVAYSPGWPTSVAGFKDSWKYEFNMAKAKSQLAAAGYPNGFSIGWWVGPSGDGVTMGEAIGGVWTAELNVKIDFDRTVYGTTFRPSIINRTVNKIWWCGTDGINFPPTWPKGFLLSTMSDGAFMCGTENRKFGQIFLDMSKEIDQAKLKQLATDFYDELRRTSTQIGVIDINNQLVYNSNVIASWDMLPEGKGVAGGLNSLFAVKLK